MLVVNLLLVAAFATPSIYLLVQFLRSSQKPGKLAAAGIITCTAVSTVYIVILMYFHYFY